MTRIAYVVCIAALGIASMVVAPVEATGADKKALLERADQAVQQSAKLALQGQYEQAIEQMKEGVRLREKALGPDDPTVAISLNTLALLLREKGDLPAAKAQYERALRIFEKAHGPDDPAVAKNLRAIALLLQAMGNYGEAKPLLERVVRMQEKALGRDDPIIAGSLSELANLHRAMGDFAEAKSLYERTLRITEKAHGSEHPDVVASLNNLALVLQAMGDYARAKPMYERALHIMEKRQPDSPLVGIILNNLAELYRLTGDYAAAKPLYERALQMKEHVHGSLHPSVATSLNNLAELYRLTGDYAAAKPLYERALRSYEQALGPTHPQVSIILNNLASLLHSMGDYAEAKPLYERSLRIKEQMLGPMHPDVALPLNNLALLNWDSGDLRQASRQLARVVSLADRLTMHSVYGLSERQTLLFLRQTDAYSANYLSLPAEWVSPSDAYALVLNRKNLAFRVLGEESSLLAHHANPATERLVARRATLRQMLAGLVFNREGNIAEREAQSQAIEKELEQVEADISRASVKGRTEPPVAKAGSAEVCAALPKDTVLLDYVSYARYIPADNPQRKQWQWESGYAVFALRGGQCPIVQRFDLGPAAPIDEAVQAFRRSLTGTRTVNGRKEPIPESEIVAKAQELGALVLPPNVRAVFAGAKTLVIAPDGPLTVIPFKLLPGEAGQTFLVESHAVATIPSGRDLLRTATGTEAQTASTAGVVLASNPDYGAQVAASVESRRGDDRAGCGLETAESFPPLPNTAQEAQTIAAQAAKAFPGAAVLRAEGREANERWVTQHLSGRRYVHLATHGYFAGEGCKPAGSGETRGVEMTAGTMDDNARIPVVTNPLLLSGIALAGANRRAQATSGADDGILTALEVTGLDLRGTELVTLSACETGLGVQQTGQELMGLRWAFSMAGAKTLLTSLWNVPDEPTVKLMTDFYGALWRSARDGGPMGKAEALRQAQLTLIKENRARYHGDSRPNDWGAWVLSGDWW